MAEVAEKVMDWEKAAELRDEINSRYRSGEVVLVNGHEVYGPYVTAPAFVYGNGTLGVHVRTKARTPGRMRDLYFKEGSAVPVVTSKEA